MTQSMTAFARHSIDLPSVTLTWEVKSVNSRYLEMFFRLPDAYQGIEASLRGTLKKKLARGKVEVTLRYQRQPGQDQQINTDVLGQLNSQINQVLASNDQLTAPDALTVLRQPGVLSEAEVDMDEVLAGAQSAFEAAIDSLIEARGREGDAMAAAIIERLDGIAEHTDYVQKVLPEALGAWQQKLRDRITELADNVDEQRFAQEVAVQAQKMDVAEELDRLHAHINEARRILNSKKPVGRQLDFLMQEFNREANTLASKAIREDITKAAVELKVLIEQMREQIQNIE
ncbi:YicC/YloC family endoribonuclease [Salinibius halmophilus]|uniref:YicC/YloC family endoribonuclease n=1 Tax=Salinibius halmophilus TaxID=1853216 RepID=UPI000E664B41|nr:YicC/YloC family endoribonuclease [Salinibius halmophilus]